MENTGAGIALTWASTKASGVVLAAEGAGGGGGGGLCTGFGLISGLGLAGTELATSALALGGGALCVLVALGLVSLGGAAGGFGGGGGASNSVAGGGGTCKAAVVARMPVHPASPSATHSAA